MEFIVKSSNIPFIGTLSIKVPTKILQKGIIAIKGLGIITSTNKFCEPEIIMGRMKFIL